MERSSPLAAMQPQSLPFGHWGGLGSGVDASASDSQFGGGYGYGKNAFDFKDLSMKKGSADYFNLRPVRGSSPTASLAADLSQNFHIDKSPQPPTPRRSLFSSSTLFGNVNREALTTPPLLASSPCPLNDSMDLSPLPHKPPFQCPLYAQLQSPTPEPTPTAEDVESSPLYVPESPLETMKAPAGFERRRPSLLRPSLSRIKGSSTTALSMRSAGLEYQRPAFKFGNGSSLTGTPLMSLEECFMESPQRNVTSNPMTPSMGPPRPKSSGYGRNSGSPMASHVRKPSFPAKPALPSQRPRKQIRRALSMFEHPAEVLQHQTAEQTLECPLQSVMDVDEGPQLQLPHFFPEEDTIPRITKETIVEILEGKYSANYDQSLIIDCRFEYEYSGGHIDGAINFNDKEELATKLFSDPSPRKTLLIFHCEYSAHRAPIAARFIRNEDRAANVHQYPKLTFPEVYILEGGYSSFFQDHKSRCFPQNYVEMNDKEHSNACERGLGRIKQQRTKFGRAQTFAFGQHTLDESPTGPSRQCATSNLMMGMDLDSPGDTKRTFTKRMASY